jgi:hypothetical protein
VLSTQDVLWSVLQGHDFYTLEEEGAKPGFSFVTVDDSGGDADNGHSRKAEA